MKPFLMIIFTYIILLTFYRMPLLSPNQQQQWLNWATVNITAVERWRPLRDCIDVRDVFRDCVNLVKFLISLGHFIIIIIIIV